MQIPVKFYFSKAFWTVFGIAAVALTVIILVLTGMERLNAEKPVRTPNAYGGENIRVRSEAGKAVFPEELPSDFVPVYPNVHMKDIWVDTDSSGGIVKVDIIYDTDATARQVTEYYTENIPGAEESGGYVTAELNGLKVTIYLKNKGDMLNVEIVMNKSDK